MATVRISEANDVTLIYKHIRIRGNEEMNASAKNGIVGPEPAVVLS